MAILWDALADGATYAAQVGSVSIAPYDALQYAAQDRQIVQGFQESTASWRARLAQWLDRWAYAGRPTGMLLFARGWILPQLPQMTVVTNSSVWWTYADGLDPMPPGAQTVIAATWQPAGVGGVQLWNWDGNTAAWWRQWLIIYSTDSPWIATSGTWGSSGKRWGDPTKSWGVNAPSSVGSGLRAIVRQVKRAGCYVPWIIISFSDATFQPTSTGGNAPDGTWGRWGKIGADNGYTASRLATARYGDVPA
jgi:hypothetical protein